MKTFEIAQGTGEKTRAFSATLVSWMTFDAGWKLGKQDGPARPIWMLWTSSASELQAFVANLRLGRRAVHLKETIQLPKKAGYHVHWISKELVEISIAYLFDLDPMVSPQEAGTTFVMAPPMSWIEAQDHPDPVAALFAGYLNKRSRVPVLDDTAFHQQLYTTALEVEFLREGAAKYSIRYRVGSLGYGQGLEVAGMSQPMSFMATDLDAFLISTTQSYMETHDYGQTREPSFSRIFSDAPESRQQLSLFPAA